VLVAEGADIVARELSLAGDLAPAATAATVVEFAGRVRQEMRRRVPVDTGRGYQAITADTEATIDGFAVYADAGPDLDVDKRAFVLRFSEYGTATQPPKPWAQPAADAVVDDFVEALLDRAVLEP